MEQLDFAGIGGEVGKRKRGRPRKDATMNVTMKDDSMKPATQVMREPSVEEGFVYVNRSLIGMIDCTQPGYVLLHVGNQQIKVQREKLRFL